MPQMFPMYWSVLFTIFSTILTLLFFLVTQIFFYKSVKTLDKQAIFVSESEWL